MTFPRRHPIVILIDDDDQLREASVQSLELAGTEVRAFPDAYAALPLITRDFEGVIVTDIRMPRMDGLELFFKVKEIDPEIPVIFITGHADVPAAVRALREGAFDFQTKPFFVDELIASTRNALEKRMLVMDNRALRASISHDDSPLLGNDPQIVKLRETIAQVAQADIDVLIEGETGTGKELTALLLHRHSKRRGKQFVIVNCAALSEHFAEVELFGQNSSVAHRDPKEKIGRIQSANSGTIFFDDIDSCSPAMQAKLLRVIEEREVQPLGAPMPTPVNVRIIAASKQNLSTLCQTGDFRLDLYYRLNVVRIQLPPLRRIRSDIPQLFSYFIDEAKSRLGLPDYAMTDAVRNHLLTHEWPGNVRELRNFAFEAALGLPEGISEKNDQKTALAARVSDFEASVIIDTLRSARGNVNDAAARLSLPRKTLYDKITKYHINPKTFRE